MPQTQYDINFDKYAVGQLAYSNTFNYVDTEIASEAIEFGRGLALQGDGTVKKVAADSDQVWGVALQTAAKQAQTLQGIAQYADKDAVNVLKVGVVAVPLLAADASGVAKGNTVYIAPSNATFTNQSSGNARLPSGVFLTAAMSTKHSDFDVALVEMNLPNQ